MRFSSIIYGRQEPKRWDTTIIQIVFASAPQCFVARWQSEYRVDARKLSDLLYMNKLKPVYHGIMAANSEELVRSY